ncbi:MAG: spondin domain-containing protein [Fimbriimonadaceae bacterium]|nr:spondin domain-containing protein [Fimbriimonadaceae bacterium]
MNRKINHLALAALFILPAVAPAIDVEVRITNLSPMDGTFLTPMWFGFHNGNFDLFSDGGSASMGLERIAEDGDAMPLASEFMASGFGSIGGLLNGVGPIVPGATTSKTVSLDLMDMKSHYFTFASMVIPSNDAFIGNENSQAHRIISDANVFVGADFVVLGSRVRDAGTEVNDEIPANTAFLGQMSPNTGVDENGVVHFHPGFIPGGNILTAFPGADFTRPDYQVARISVKAVPEPTSLVALGLGALAVLRRRVNL